MLKLGNIPGGTLDGGYGRFATPVLDYDVTIKQVYDAIEQS